MNKSKTLSDLQTLVQKAVQQNIAPTALINSIVEKPPISINQRLKIYQDAYRIRLVESLRDDFSRVEAALGNEEFEALALKYININPSRFQNLAEYSEGFTSFVHKSHPELSKAAVTDWLEILSTNAKSPTNQVSPEKIQAGHAFKVKLHPSTQFQEAQRVFVIAYRNQNEVETLDLDKSLSRLLQFLDSARSLEEVMAFAQINSMPDETITNTLHEWIKTQIIYCQYFEEDL